MDFTLFEQPLFPCPLTESLPLSIYNEIILQLPPSPIPNDEQISREPTTEIVITTIDDTNNLDRMIDTIIGRFSNIKPVLLVFGVERIVDVDGLKRFERRYNQLNEFDDAKFPALPTNTLLNEQYRSPGAKFDGHSNQAHHRRRHNQGCDGHREIKQAFRGTAWPLFHYLSPSFVLGTDGTVLLAVLRSSWIILGRLASRVRWHRA